MWWMTWILWFEVWVSKIGGLDYLMTENMFWTISPISCMILHMPRLSTTNENSHTCVTMYIDSEYVILFKSIIFFYFLFNFKWTNANRTQKVCHLLWL